MGLQDILEKKLKEMGEKVKAKDFQAATAFYTENCVLLPSTGETIIGRADVVKFWEVAIGKLDKAEFASKTLEVLEGEGSGLVASRGSYTFVCEGKETSRGNFVMIWKKTNGDYQVQYDIWNEVKSQ